MFKEIYVEENNSVNLALFDTHGIVVNRKNDNNVELVIHPSATGSVSVRYAKEPYCCSIRLANGETKDIDLGDECDWGNIQQMCPYDYFKEGDKTYPKDWDDRIGWGNDADGHIEIVKVTTMNGSNIPLKEFWKDVKDFIIYYEG